MKKLETEKVIAHKRKVDGKTQSLASHLTDVGSITSSLAAKIKLQSAGELIGLLHDFGKFSQAFQRYIKSATGEINPDKDDYVDAGKLKGKIDHSSAGAQYVWRALGKFGNAGQGELCGQLLALCIASHHSGLIDCFNLDGEATFLTRMEKEDFKTHLMECREVADKEIIERIEKLAGKDLVTEMLSLIKKVVSLPASSAADMSKIDYFNLGFLLRFLFSCLIDADRLDSAEFEDPARKEERLNNAQPIQWPVAIARLEAFLGSLESRNYVDDLRKEISNNCKVKASSSQGIYTLTVPTGGGKTYASLRYALQHAETHKLDRIIYVIPYTSIIEQNATAIRDVIEKDSDTRKWVLEHHSNLEPEQQTWKSKLVSENWDAPIVLTTMVQLLETFFSGGTRGVRRLHQLANSVLIFDEIQTLPINCTHIFCNAINFLRIHCRTTTVLCTATQPLLDNLKASEKGQLIIPKENELAGNVAKYFVDLNRVDIRYRCRPEGWSAEEISKLALDQLDSVGSCLLIVNTKAWAQALYQHCETEVDRSVLFHLSTNQYPAHRKAILGKIRNRLDAGLPVLCISTQLIEAGVDIDFAAVIRFLAGLDSIAQAAGRCNRNGKLEDSEGNKLKGQVHIVNPDVETVDLLTDIKVGKKVAARIFSESHNDWLAPAAMERYFQYYFYDRADDMAYKLSSKRIGRDDNLLNLLSDNPLCSAQYKNRSNKLPLLKQSFMEAGKQFRAIDAPTHSVIVAHGEGKSLIADLCAVAKQFDAHRYYTLLRQAQKFSVNVFPNVWQRLLEKGAVHETQEGDGIYYLKEEYYSDEFGLSSEPSRKQSFLGV